MKYLPEHRLIARLLPMSVDDSQGFTLIELIVVVAIIGIVAAIALPQYAEFKTRSYNANAQYSIKSLINAEEAYFADALLYIGCDGSNACENNLIGFKQTKNVEIEADLVASGFSSHACSALGTKHYVYDSEDDASKFAQPNGIGSNAVGVLDNVPAGASISESCEL